MQPFPDDTIIKGKYCPKCGFSILLLFLDKVKCPNCDWEGYQNEVIGKKGLRKLKIEKLNE